jgi:hypothetical protein
MIYIIGGAHTGSPAQCSWKSLHLVEHGRERGLQFERLLDLVGANVRILAVFEETRALMFANERHEGRRIGLPVLRESFEIFEDCRDASGGEQRDSVLSVFVEVYLSKSVSKMPWYIASRTIRFVRNNSMDQVGSDPLSARKMRSFSLATGYSS